MRFVATSSYTGAFPPITATLVRFLKNADRMILSIPTSPLPNLLKFPRSRKDTKASDFHPLIQIQYGSQLKTPQDRKSKRKKHPSMAKAFAHHKKLHTILISLFILQ